MARIGGMRKLAEVLVGVRESPPDGSSSSESECGPDGETACPLCAGAGFVTVRVPFGHPDFGRALRCRCNPPPATVGIPPRFEVCAFENFKLALNLGMKVALGAVQEVAEGRSWGTLLIGEYGTGKTHLAIATMKTSIHERPSVFWSVPLLLDFWRRAYNVDAFNIEDLMRPYLMGKFLLVLDDLGTEKPTEWAGERLYEVIDARYGASLPTIVTSNVDPGRLDPRIISRFGRGVVACTGKDVRLRKGVGT